MPIPREGNIIVFEGVDKIGKSTVAEKVVNRIGNDAHLERFPSTEWPEIRKIATRQGFSAIQRMLAHALSHSLSYTRINEKLGQGKIVVCDRFWWSALVYSGGADQIDLNRVQTAENFANPPIPDIVFYLYSDGLYPNFYNDEEVDEDDFYENQEAKVRGRILRLYEKVMQDVQQGPSEFVGLNVDNIGDANAVTNKVFDYISVA